jgi:hypothetical protein
MAEATVHVDETVAEWVRVLNRALRVAPGVTVLDILWAPVRCVETHVNYHIGGDACVGRDTPQPGLAGSMHGVAWYYALNMHECRLPIPPLEFGVLYGDAEMLLPLVPDDSVEVTIHSDAATAVFDMVASSRVPASTVMAWTRRQILMHTQVKRLMYRLFVAHRKGASNAFDDAISRGYWEVARQLARQLRIQVRWVPVTDAFRGFMTGMVKQLSQQATQKAALGVVPPAATVSVAAAKKQRAADRRVVAACTAQAAASLLGVHYAEALQVVDAFVQQQCGASRASDMRRTVESTIFGFSRWLRNGNTDTGGTGEPEQQQQLREQVMDVLRNHNDAGLRMLCAAPGEGHPAEGAAVCSTGMQVHAALWQQCGVFPANATVFVAYAGHMYHQLKLEQYEVDPLIGVAVHVEAKRFLCYTCNLAADTVALVPVVTTARCERWAALEATHWSVADASARASWVCVHTTAAEPRLTQCVGLAGEYSGHSRPGSIEQARRALGFGRHVVQPDMYTRCGIYGLADLNGGAYTRQWVMLAYGRWLDGCQATETLRDVVWSVTEQWLLTRSGGVTADWWQLVAVSANRALRHVPPIEVENRDNVEYAAWYLQRWHNTGFTPTSFALLKAFYREWGERLPQPEGAAPPLSIVVEVYMPVSASPTLSEVWGIPQPRTRSQVTDNMPKLVLRDGSTLVQRARSAFQRTTGDVA